MFPQMGKDTEAARQKQLKTDRAIATTSRSERERRVTKRRLKKEMKELTRKLELNNKKIVKNVIF